MTVIHSDKPSQKSVQKADQTRKLAHRLLIELLALVHL